MRTRRVHIMGASGAGATTLGRALADALGAPPHDTDDYFWRPTTPPFTHKREASDRLRLMSEMFLGRSEWVLSGALEGWGDPIIPYFDLVVFLRAPAEIRLRRLRERQARLFGARAILVDGARHEPTEEFIAWASNYDEPSFEGRNVSRHEAWLRHLPCRVLDLDGVTPVGTLVQTILGNVPCR